MLDCNVFGICYGGVDFLICVNCVNNMMGFVCEFFCFNGYEYFFNSVFCKCDLCYSGFVCDVECFGCGVCN